jgi:uncharacterized repeat protein (TIGR03843 family)
MPTPDLLAAELTLTGRVMTASNATFVGRIGEVEVVYKPIAGEAPLWDFPGGALAHREVAAFQVSQVFGGDVVPRTWLREGPFGEGMVQLWQEADPSQDPVDLLPADQVPATGWKQVLEGLDEDGRAIALVHEDSPALRRMAVFDVLVNNADRKGDHVLALAGGHRHGVDHGLTFHREDKLRTVLWGWRGEALTADETEGIDRVLTELEGELGRVLASLLTVEEIAALAERCHRLRRAGRFPSPRGGMPAVPWPLF